MDIFINGTSQSKSGLFFIYSIYLIFLHFFNNIIKFEFTVGVLNKTELV